MIPALFVSDSKAIKMSYLQNLYKMFRKQMPFKCGSERETLMLLRGSKEYKIGHPVKAIIEQVLLFVSYRELSPPSRSSALTIESSRRLTLGESGNT